jgi:hypothetical protein
MERSSTMVLVPVDVAIVIVGVRDSGLTWSISFIVHKRLMFCETDLHDFLVLGVELPKKSAELGSLVI